MIVVRREDVQMLESWYEGDESARWRSSVPFEPLFPGFSGNRTEKLGVVYFEMDPGRRLGEHTDSAEELLYVLAGEVEVAVGAETRRLEPGDMAVIPADVAHGVRNLGRDTARCLGVFSSPRVAHRFSAPVMPLGVTEIDPAATPAE